MLLFGIVKKMEEKKQILDKLYDDFLKEKDSIQKEIDNCKNKISEIDSYIASITGKEDSDFKVFSPRDVESIYKDSLEENRNLKSKYEEDYKVYVKKREKIDSRLKKVKKLLLNYGDEVHIFDIQEKERQRISRDLHDSSLQNLTHTIHKLELASLYIDKDPIQAKLEIAEISKDIREVIEEIRNTIFDLRPMQFDDFGLKDSVEQLIEKIKKDSSINIKCDIDNNINSNNKNILLTIFRIIQECINNAIKHSNGSLIELKIKKIGECFDIIITDDGEGFNVSEVFSEKAKRHFGLMILEERVNILNGTINIESEIEKGTKVHVQLPLKYLDEE